MRRRQTRNNNQPRQNLDSFLDILTNTVGVLMFIGLFVSLLAVEAGTVIRTPLRSQTKKVGKFFEVRNNQVFYLSDPNIQDAIDEVVASIPICRPPDVPDDIPRLLYDFYLQEIAKYDRCILRRNAHLESFYYNNANYAVTFTPEGSLKYEPIPNSNGDTTKNISKDESVFGNVLENLDPKVHYIAFVVRPDSFSAFRVARQKAWNSGYDVGWEPFTEDTQLVFVIFGSGGRSVDVQ